MSAPFRPLRLALFGPTAIATLAVASAATAKPAKQPAPPPLPVSVELTASEATKWTVKLKNGGPAPLKIPVDSRLVGLDVTPTQDASKKTKAKPKIVHCNVPTDFRPEADEVGMLSIDPGKSVAIDFDPRMVCFSNNDATALASAERVTARYVLLGVAPPGRGGIPALTSEPVEIAEAARPPLRPGTDTSANEKADVLVSMTPRFDGTRATTTQLRIEIRNQSERARSAFFRPGNVGFVVEGPTGAFSCPVKGTAPIRELETGLTARGKVSIDVLLGPTCVGRLFDRPGLYVVRPVFASQKPPWDQGKSLIGEWVGPPSLVRLRVGTRPFVAPPPRVE